MFLLKVSIFVCCLVLINAQEGCPYLKACLEETKGKVTLEDVKKIISISNEEEYESIPTEVLCVLECAMRKRGVLIGEWIDLKKLAADEKLMELIRDREPYFECVEKSQFKECDDIKKYLKCTKKYTKHD